MVRSPFESHGCAAGCWTPLRRSAMTYAITSPCMTCKISLASRYARWTVSTSRRTRIACCTSNSTHASIAAPASPFAPSRRRPTDHRDQSAMTARRPFSEWRKMVRGSYGRSVPRPFRWVSGRHFFTPSCDGVGVVRAARSKPPAPDALYAEARNRPPSTGQAVAERTADLRITPRIEDQRLGSARHRRAWRQTGIALPRCQFGGRHGGISCLSCGQVVSEPAREVWNPVSTVPGGSHRGPTTWRSFEVLASSNSRSAIQCLHTVQRFWGTPNCRLTVQPAAQCHG